MVSPFVCLSSKDETMEECSSPTLSWLDNCYKKTNQDDVAQEVMKFVQESQESILEDASQFSRRMDPIFKRLKHPALNIEDASNGMHISSNLKRARPDESFEQSEELSEIMSEGSSNGSSSSNGSGSWNGSLPSLNGSLPHTKRRKKWRSEVQNEKKFVCEFCQRSYVKEGNLMRHKRIHFKTPYYCMFCPKYFKHKHKLNKHIKVHTTISGDKMLKCSFCSKNFFLLTSLTQHVLTGCIYAQKHRANVRTQAHRARVMIQGEGFLRRDQVKRFQCPCGVTCATKHTLAKHYNTHKFQCAFCFKFFSNEAMLAGHLSSRHFNIIAG